MYNRAFPIGNALFLFTGGVMSLFRLPRSDDSYAKTETLKILKQHKAYMAQFEEMLNDEKIA